MSNETTSVDKYFLKQHIKCRQYLHQYNLKKSNEPLHQLRVVIKKIKAILQMLNKLEPEFKRTKNFTPYHNIFGHVAPIREELLQKEKLKQFAEKGPQQKHRSNLVAMFNKELKTSSTGYLKATETVLPEILNYLRKVEQKSILLYCQKQLKKLKRDWSKIKKDKELHQYRKQLKTLLYCSKLLLPKEKDKLLSPKGFGHMDKLQDIIGQWHDNDLLLTRISDDKLKVSPQSLRSLKAETRELAQKAYKKGNKL